MAVQPKRFCLFNCDNTYDLKIVEEFLLEVDEKYKYKMSVDRLYFGLRRMAEMVETTLPTLKMDFAIFVVHANESRLSINEENAGIGYARLYKALLRATDGKVLIVIGGDSYYKDEDEEDKFVISRWARRKVASQFDEEYLDGRKSFIFSWDTKHRPIHEEALRQYLDPAKKGVTFVFTPKPKPLPRAAEPEFISPASQDALEEPFLVEDDEDELIKNDKETRTRRRSVSGDRGEQREGLRGDVEEVYYGAINPNASGTSVDYPADTVLLQTRMRCGNISYQREDVLIWEDRWQPSDWQLTHLREDYQLTPEAQVRFISDGYGGVSYTVIVSKPGCCARLKNCLRSCCICLLSCFAVCFWGSVSFARYITHTTPNGSESYTQVIVPQPDCCTRLKNCLCSCCTRLKNCLCSCCTRLKNCLCSCCICLKDSFVACFLGLVHCFGLLWGWIVGLFRR